MNEAVLAQDAVDENKYWFSGLIVPILVISMIATSYQAMAAYLSVYVMQDLGASGAAYGLTFTGWTIVALFVRPAVGPLSLKYGSKTLLLVGCVIFAAMIAACGIYMTFTAFFIFRMLQGAGHSLSYTSANSLAAESVPQSRMGVASSLYIGIPQATCIVAGPWLAVALIGSDNNWFRFFSGIGGFMIAGMVMAAIFIKSHKKEDAEAQKKKAEAREAARYDAHGNEYKGIWKIIEKTSVPGGITMILGSLAHCTMFFLTAYVAKTYGGVSAAIFFSAQAGTEFACRFWMGFVQDKYGIKALLIPCCIICCGVYIAIGGGYTSWIVLGLIYGIGQAGIKAPINASMMKACPKNRIPVANSTFQFANAAGLGLAVFIAGSVIDKFGFSTMWYYCAAMFIVTAVVGAIIIKESPATKLA